MKTNNKIFNFFIIIICLFLQFCVFKDYYITSEIIGNLVTILSIFFGFYITSLAIFTSSKYVSNLYNIESSDDNGLTLLDVLIYNFKKGLFVILFSLIYFILVIFKINQTVNNELVFSSFVLFPLLTLIVFDFILSFQMISILIKIIRQEAKNKK